MKKAKDLWERICKLAGRIIFLTFIQDTSLPFGSYKITGSKIAWSGDENTPADIFAVARLAWELFGAIMPRPGEIILQKNTEAAQEFSYIPKYQPLSLDNLVSGKIKEWFSWHHVPTIRLTEDFHRSWWLSLAQNNPNIAPASGIDELTKPDILHPDFPSICFANYIERGSPDQYSCFEIDGGNYWWVEKYFKAPEWFNPIEKDFWSKTLLYAGNFERQPGEYKLEGVPYTYSQEAFNTIQSLPRAGATRLNYTELYIKAYKAIEAYFHQQGAHPRFRILAYARYYEAPQWASLENFDVYFCPPGSTVWTPEGMETALINWQRWRQTGARMIARPNWWLDLTDTYALHCEFIRRIKPDGIVIDTKYDPAININIYTMMRTLQGATLQQAEKEFNTGGKTGT
jgi:hypothetical protein